MRLAICNVAPQLVSATGISLETFNIKTADRSNGITSFRPAGLRG